MSKIERVERVTSWKRALNAARRTIGKEPIDKEPSDSWKAKMLLAEHSPIRLVEYEWTWKDIKQWVTAHLVRHHVGCEKMVHSQREDRRNLTEEFSINSRDELPQGTLNDMDMSANAQALINISRKRLCNCASKETREAWLQVKEAIKSIDPIMAEKMVPECQYRNFCPEWMNCCGYINSVKYQLERVRYLRTDYDDQWTPIKGYEGIYEISRFGIIRSVARKIKIGDNIFKEVPTKEISIFPNKKRRNYCYVHLYKDNKEECKLVHRLVAETFIPNPDNKPEVNHIDGNKFNNQVSNLEWVTSKENKRHAWDNKLCTADHKKVKIRCIQNNIIYNSVIECSKALNMDVRGIFRQLKGEINNVKGYTFERV